jgi:hypothetical protein
VGLRLRFRLSARGPFVREDATLLADLVSLLKREDLIDARGATLSLRAGDAVPTRLPLLEGRALGARLAGERAQVLEVSGMRTADRFPNPFLQYTLGEEVIEAWVVARHVRQPAGERRFELEFIEPQFLADVPLITPHRLVAQLKTVVGTSLTAECVSTEPEERPV